MNVDRIAARMGAFLLLFTLALPWSLHSRELVDISGFQWMRVAVGGASLILYTAYLISGRRILERAATDAGGVILFSAVTTFIGDIALNGYPVLSGDWMAELGLVTWMAASGLLLMSVDTAPTPPPDPLTGDGQPLSLSAADRPPPPAGAATFRHPRRKPNLNLNIHWRSTYRDRP